jgi:hypothetical protein
VFYGLIVFIEFLFYRNIKRFITEAIILLGVILLLNVTTGFPSSSRQAFGGISQVVAIAIMFVCTIFGICANYFFYLKGNFSWMSLLKPLCVSPIVLLPLLGSVQGISEFESIQLISFGFLAFQNGFFWKTVFEHAKNQI